MLALYLDDTHCCTALKAKLVLHNMPQKEDHECVHSWSMGPPPHPISTTNSGFCQHPLKFQRNLAAQLMLTLDINVRARLTWRHAGISWMCMLWEYQINICPRWAKVLITFQISGPNHIFTFWRCIQLCITQCIEITCLIYMIFSYIF